ncbi:MAG TPA: M23 family metallopeptidase [Terriglobales bacterium]|nr:M23 family metallopeptidase [Terriglobales bacterium]
MRKRFYILFVARDAEGQLRKIPIPLHYAQVFLVGALIGMLSITGMAGSYARMLMKVMRFNQVRAEKERLKTRYSVLEKVAQEKDIQVASLGSLANEVTALYGLKAQPILTTPRRDLPEEQVKRSLDQFAVLRTSALNGGAAIGITMMGGRRNFTAADWLRLSEEPNLWPVEGRITGSFGERIDPFNGEGAFHSGVDISTPYGSRVIAPADGVVTFADFYSGYGRLIEIEHSQGFITRYGHLASFAVTPGQTIHRGQVIGYVGLSGRSTGPHLHYEVWIHNNPVNPYHFLRTTVARATLTNAGE